VDSDLVPVVLAALAVTSLAREVTLTIPAADAAVVAAVAPAAVDAVVPLGARAGLPQLLNSAADAAVVARAGVAAVVLAVGPTERLRSAIVQAADVARNGRPASLTISRIQR